MQLGSQYGQQEALSIASGVQSSSAPAEKVAQGSDTTPVSRFTEVASDSSLLFLPA